MSLWYSRLAASDEDYANYFGFSKDERDIPRVEYSYDPLVASEIESLYSQLPFSLAAAYELCKRGGVSQKWYLNSVRLRRSDLETQVFRNGLSMPAVSIGNAAHAIPELFSPGDINHAMMDAFDLSSMFIDRYEDDELFARIPGDYYDIKFRGWQKLHFNWGARWHQEHGLTYDSGDERFKWVKLTRTARLEEREIMSEREFMDLPDGDRSAIQRYKESEIARWGVIQQRIRDRFQQKKMFTVPSGVEPTEIVLRYLDSRSQSGKDAQEVRDEDQTSKNATSSEPGT